MNISSIANAVNWASSRLSESTIFFGHGADCAESEAVMLLAKVFAMSPDDILSNSSVKLTDQQQTSYSRLVEQRLISQKPSAYLINKAWFAGLEFYVNEQVLVPRSPIAELILNGYSPWLTEKPVNGILDMCTGSGCIAIASASVFPDVPVHAADVSFDALAVAEINRKKHQLESRLSLYHSDLFSKIPRHEYDLIVTNPPYISQAEYQDLPKEYYFEPKIGLVSGEDGFDCMLQILSNAHDYMSASAVLIGEVGHGWEHFLDLIPMFNGIWLDFEYGGEGVFVMTKEQLCQIHDDVERIITNRKRMVKKES